MTSVQSNILIHNFTYGRPTVALCSVGSKSLIYRVGTICTYPIKLRLYDERLNFNRDESRTYVQSYPKWVHLKSIHYNVRRLLKNHTLI